MMTLLRLAYVKAVKMPNLITGKKNIFETIKKDFTQVVYLE